MGLLRTLVLSDIQQCVTAGSGNLPSYFHGQHLYLSPQDHVFGSTTLVMMVPRAGRPPWCARAIIATFCGI